MKSKIFFVSLFFLMLIVSIAGRCVVKADTAGEPKVSYDTWGRLPGWHSYENLTLIILSPLPNEVLTDNTRSCKSEHKHTSMADKQRLLPSGLARRDALYL